GGSLDKAPHGAPRPARAAASLVEVLARAIAEAHRRGIIHRDLKPANILLETDGHPKVADFGLAKFLDSDDRLTKTQMVLGSPSYMAPEQAEGHMQGISPATDVYSLGAILYELLTGRPPFQAATTLETLAQVKAAEPVPPSRLQPGLPRDLETICLTCLQKVPPKRYPTANALAEDLRRFLSDESILARPSPMWERAWKWARRRPTAAAALAISAAAVILLFGGALFYNARLQTAVRSAQAAQHAASEQRNLALKALDQLVYGDREELGETAPARPLRRRQLATAIDVLNQIARGAEASAPDLSRAVAHQKLGDIFRQVGRLTEARRQYELARRLSEGLADPAHRTLPIKECLRGTYYGLGALVLKEGQNRAAIDYFQRVVDLAEGIVQTDPIREGARRALLEAYLQLGRAYSFALDLNSAETWFHKMHDSAENWASEEPQNWQVKDLLASSYRKLGDVRKLSHDPEPARRDYLKAIAIGREILAAEPGTVAYKGHLAIALDDLAGVSFHQGRVEEARSLYQEAGRLFNEQAEADPESSDAQHWLLRAQFNLASLERDDQRYAEGADLYRRALERVLRLKREGKIELSPERNWERIELLKQQLSDCQAAPIALGPLDVIQARPAAEAARLLLFRARTMAAHARPDEALSAIKALCDLKVGETDDLIEIAQSLASCIGTLAAIPAADPPSQDLLALRQLCANRAVAALASAIDRGFTDVRRLENEKAFASLSQQPGYRQLLDRLRASSPPIVRQATSP
ncbi:MAG TPA: serine/threonine-protein kinase, partial [Isosphaeraceae bacterium]|nr:serine/threonine-protein kinase [Isosphaeraceae bacterium]